MYSDTWYQWLTYFYIYCFLGWIFESTYVSLKQRHLINRGFLRIPLLPLYGSGAIMMLWISLPFQDNLVLVYISGIIGATILEYITGFAMERIFKMKYWDYSSKPYNLNGYICLSSSIAWGFLTLFLTEVIHKPVENLIFQIPAITNILLAAIFSVIFVADAAISIKQALSFSQLLAAITNMKADLDDIQLQLSLLKAEAAQKVFNIKNEQMHRASILKGETELKLYELLAAFKEGRDEISLKATNEISALAARLQAITDDRKNILKHLNYYRKGLLRRNPTVSSRQFEAALKDFKDMFPSRKSRK